MRTSTTRMATPTATAHNAARQPRHQTDPVALLSLTADAVAAGGRVSSSVIAAQRGKDQAYGDVPTPGPCRLACRLVISWRQSRRSAVLTSLDQPTISRISCAVADGVLPTRTPTASRASCFAAAVPLEPETIAPAWPIVLPSGAVKPAK